MGRRSPWALLYRWPVRQAHQMLFAEAFSQALDAGINILASIPVAAAANPSPRLRAALGEMTTNFSGGHSLAWSLRSTGIAVRGELVTAIEIGEDRGCLSEQLAAFACRYDPAPPKRLAVVLGRSPEVIRFVNVLAQLLAEHRLSPGLITDAGRLASEDRSFFAGVTEQIAAAIKDGESFSSALSRQPRIFDPMLCHLVGVPDGREKLRAVLMRLGGNARVAF